jgi:tryptophan synthase alpha chain
MLEKKIRERLKRKPILLMMHTVLGYPSLRASLDLLETLAGSGTDVLELQIPFSDPVADGPRIVQANEEAIRNGVTVAGCLELAGTAARSLSVPIVVMTYYNVVYRYGVERFAESLDDMGVEGLLIPDLPPEEGERFLHVVKDRGLSPVLTLSPTTPEERMDRIVSLGEGFVYCVARRGVTGSPTRFASEIASYLARCRRATHLPLAVGFGVSCREDVAFLEGKAEIAVVGTELLKRLERDGPGDVGAFVRSLVNPGVPSSPRA